MKIRKINNYEFHYDDDFETMYDKEKNTMLFFDDSYGNYYITILFQDDGIVFINNRNWDTEIEEIEHNVYKLSSDVATIDFSAFNNRME